MFDETANPLFDRSEAIAIIVVILGVVIPVCFHVFMHLRTRRNVAFGGKFAKIVEMPIRAMRIKYVVTVFERFERDEPRKR